MSMKTSMRAIAEELVTKNVCSLSSNKLDERVELIRSEILPSVIGHENRPNGVAWEFESKQLGMEVVKHEGRFYRCIKKRVEYVYAGGAYNRTYWYAAGIGLFKAEKTSTGSKRVTSGITLRSGRLGC